MTTAPCPSCGTPRAGVQRFCPQCAFDYWRAAQGVEQHTTADPQPVAVAPAKSSSPAGFIVGLVVALLLVWGGYSFLTGAADDVEHDVATALDDDPTPRPTPRPTPAEPINVGAVSLQLFGLHVAEQGPALADGMFQVGEDATNLDLPALVDSSVDLWVELGEEVAWAESNPPHECYAQLHADWSDAMSTLYEAMDLISDGAIYQDVDMLTEGTALMTEGNEKVNGATDGLDAAVAACN